MFRKYHEQNNQKINDVAKPSGCIPDAPTKAPWVFRPLSVALVRLSYNKPLKSRILLVAEYSVNKNPVNELWLRRKSGMGKTYGGPSREARGKVVNYLELKNNLGDPPSQQHDRSSGPISAGSRPLPPLLHDAPTSHRHHPVL
ncbi:hypothetical protein AVEN_232219-1 [Araneus ventricosus]|uniref:Uncharacterized protein n=1 Tax=Araneus ventricosus TaxID=182803 RepID=A0A4Y2JY20_ARAVE|nr:hypothetical protein AVEN_232219-1 [Araneus ventricosus]